LFIRLGEYTTLNAFQCGKGRVTSGIINETQLTKNEKAPLNVLIQWGLRCVRHEKTGQGLSREWCYSRNSVPKPKNATKPTMSVTVVKMTDPDSAGSIFSLSNITGTNTPASAAATMLNSMAKQITNPNMASVNQK